MIFGNKVGVQKKKNIVLENKKDSRPQTQNKNHMSFWSNSVVFRRIWCFFALLGETLAYLTPRYGDFVSWLGFLSIID